MKGRGLLIATFAGLACFGVFAGWAIFEASRIGEGWSDLLPIWPYVLGGVVFTAGLTGALMWLAFYSARKGYDDRIGPDGPH